MKLGEGINWTRPAPEPERRVVGEIVWSPDDTAAQERHAALEARLSELGRTQSELAQQNQALRDELAKLRQPKSRRVERDDDGNISRIIEED